MSTSQFESQIRPDRVGNLEDEVLRLQDQLTTKVVKSQDRLGGDRPLEILEKPGGEKLMKITTEVVEAGKTGQVFLTENGLAGAPPVFSGQPKIQVWCDAQAQKGGFGKAGAPVSPTASYSTKEILGNDIQVDWEIADKTFSVTVTNSDVVDCDFLVIAEGY